MVGWSRIVLVGLVGAAPAAAQVTPVAELWREWVVLDRLVDDAREEADRARRAARLRRNQRANGAAERVEGDRGTGQGSRP